MADVVLPDALKPLCFNTARLDRSIHSERHVRIICIGAGASGLLLAYKLQRHFQNYSLQVYEKNHKVGGTWLENTYPGCSCDIPAHNYTYSFEPKVPTAAYPPSSETLEYFEEFADKYELRRFIKLRHLVAGAYWDATRSQWDVVAKNVATGASVIDSCDILVNGSGVLNNWKWPKIEGLETFEGPKLHTASWDHSVSLDNKRVGLIGNGSSGIQVLPAIRERCERVFHFIRSATWAMPLQGFQQHVFTKEERDNYIRKPETFLAHRKKCENDMNTFFQIFLNKSPINLASQAFVEQQMRAILGDHELGDKLIPKWSLGCRRLTPGINYLQALVRPDVQVVYGGAEKVTKNSVIAADGSEHQIDVLACATGFDASFRPRFPVINGEGANLQDVWAQDADANCYMGVAAAGFPNYFTFLGPSSAIGNGPVLPGIESQADWICQVIDRYQTTNIASITPKEEAVREFAEFKNEYMKRCVWVEPCSSWYKAGSSDGKSPTALWPGSTLHYMEFMREVRFDDLDIKYKGNRYSWLGNGLSQTEVDESADSSYYIRDYDDDAPMATGARMRAINKSGTLAKGSPMANGSESGPRSVQRNEYTTEPEMAVDELPAEPNHQFDGPVPVSPV